MTRLLAALLLPPRIVCSVCCGLVALALLASAMPPPPPPVTLTLTAVMMTKTPVSAATPWVEITKPARAEKRWRVWLPVVYFESRH